MKKIKQFRYVGTGSSQNQLDNKAVEELINGSLFSQYTPIIQLGIQSLPGTRFYLNGSPEPIIIGTSGVFELNEYHDVKINSLRFDPASINTITSSTSLLYPSAMILIDIVYEED